MQAFLKELNDKQREVVTSPLKENRLVLAGAGSGKTGVLVARMAWLIEEKHLSPQDLLAVTFTNKAAGEMRERLSAMLSMPVLGLWIGTFHGLCHRLLRRHYQKAHLTEQFHILDSEDQGRLIKRVIASLSLDPEQWPVKQAQSFINGRKEEGLRPRHIHAPQGTSKTLVGIYQAYEQACSRAGVIDFSEILLRAHELLRDNPEVLAHYRQRFQTILVDEFQDTNTIQYAWIRLLAGEDTTVLAVGDDDQSIYGWRGAKVENIQQFAQDFKETKITRLEQNYRSTSTILKAANALISNNPTRLGKELWTAGQVGEPIVVYAAFNELDEAYFVSQRIQKEIRQGYSSQDIAILYRSNAQSRVLEEALLRAGIAYRIHGGVRFFDRAEVKDTLAYLRLIVNPHDDTAFERVVNFPTRGIGEKTLDDLRLYSKSQQSSLWDAAKISLLSDTMTPRSASSLSKFIELIEGLERKTGSMELDEQLAEVLQQSGLYAHFSKVKGEKSESRLDNLQELINAAKQFRYEEEEEETPLVHAFLAHASLESGEMQADKQENHVHLMTLHSAKGLEFPIVFLVGMEEGLFPSKQSMEETGRLEEERRLCYVGMTRAKEKLILSYAEVRRLYGREEYHGPSPFIRELPHALLEEVRVKSVFQAPKTSQNNKLPSPVEERGIPMGKNVAHAKFGQGVVLAVEGSGAHTRVQVKFSNQETKWLVLAYANLRVLG